MQELLRWLAIAFDVPLEPGSELQLQLAGFPAGGRGLLVLLGVLLALGLVVHAYARDAGRLSRGRRTLLTALRAAAVGCAILLLLDPRIVAVRREVQSGHTLVLVDASQSMGHRDSWERPAVAPLAASWRELGVADPAAASRLELARTLLHDGADGLLETLRRDNKVLVYAVGANAEPLAVLDRSAGSAGAAPPAAPAGDGGDAPPDSFDPRTLRAEGAWTNLGGALRTALGRSGNAEIAGVVLLSDGRRNLGPQGPETARILRNRGVPATVVLPIGDPSPLQTLRIARSEAPEKVFQGDPFQITAVLEGDGYDEVEFELRLSRAAADGSDPSVVDSRMVRVAGEAETEVVFDDLRAEQPGVSEWSLEIVPPRFEPAAPQRHLRKARIEVLGEQTRVLLLAGGPSHEYRMLRNLLLRDETIEVACWLQSADPDFPQDGDVSLEELPTRAGELGEYDVFLLLDPDSDELQRTFATGVAEQVQENGAGLWWVCGEKFTLDALRPTAATAPLAELLPVEVDMRAADETIGLARGMPRPFRYRPTPAGAAHKAARIAEDRNASAALWPRLPGFYFAFPVARARPAAQVLVTHGRPASPGDEGDESPLIATQFVGAGRVLFTATDDTYRWRQTHEQAYDRFWVKGIRYLYEGRLGAGSSLLRLTADDERIELGQAVRIVADARTPEFEPRQTDGITATVHAPEDDPDSTLELTPIEGAPGRYQGWLRPRRTGWHRVTAGDADGGADGDDAAELAVEVVPAAIEKEGPTDIPELAAIAAVPGGVLVEDPGRLSAQAAAAIRPATRIEPFTTSRALWDSWYTVILLTLVLGSEWWLRKRSNLL